MKRAILLGLLAVAGCSVGKKKKTEPFTPMPVSLLQEKRDIYCSSDRVHQFRLGKRDRWAELETKESVAEYYAENFFDDAVLLKNEHDKSLLFHIFRNGRSSITVGTIYPLVESDCDDTGASKTCRNRKIERLYWTPEWIQLKAEGTEVNLPVTRYGFFPNDATFFYASGEGRALVLIDYGRKLQLLSGWHEQLVCGYGVGR